MNTFMIVLAVILGIVGIIGSVMPGLPGPPLSWLGVLLMYFFGGTNGAGEPMSLTLLFAGLIFPLPGGMLFTSILGAFLAELLLAGKDAGPSLKASLGAFLGFLSGTGMKLIVSAVMLYYIIVYI